jgi:hypothetical protein
MGDADAALTDEQLIETIREGMQASIGRAAQSLADGKTLADVLEAEPMSLQIVTIVADDLREIGSFVLETPHGNRRHWVYRRRDDRKIAYAVSWTNRMRLQQLGFAQLEAFVCDPNISN